MTNKPSLNRSGLSSSHASEWLLEVIRQGEGTCIEFKNSFQKEVIETLTAFANSLIDQVERIMGYIVKHTNKAYIITGNPRREERWDYPMDALREIVINMIVHRDYRSANDSTIKIFDDRIEFFNPGTLLDDLTVDMIKNGQLQIAPAQ